MALAIGVLPRRQNPPPKSIEPVHYQGLELGATRAPFQVFIPSVTGDRLEGYLVLQAHRLDETRGVNVVDWEGETAEVRARLLDAALRWGRFPAIGIWTLGLPEAALALLRPCALRDVGDCRLLEPDRWDIRMIYSMAG